MIDQSIRSKPASVAQSTPAIHALVWGACGFIGKHLVGTLLSQGHKVSVLTRKRDLYPPHWWDNEVTWHELQGNENDRRVMEEALAGVDVIYVFTIPGSPVQTESAEGRTLERAIHLHGQFLESCQGIRRRIVLASTRHVYGPTGDRRVTESQPCAPTSLYGKTAVAVENLYLAADHVSSSVCRLTNIYGPAAGCGQAGHGVLNKMISTALHDKTIRVFGSGEQFRDYLYIEDTVEGMIACAMQEQSSERVFNLGAGHSIHFADAASVIARQTGAEVHHVPWPHDYLNSETGDFHCDISLAQRVFGFAPRFDFDNGVAATLQALNSYAT